LSYEKSLISFGCTALRKEIHNGTLTIYSSWIAYELTSEEASTKHKEIYEKKRDHACEKTNTITAYWRCFNRYYPAGKHIKQAQKKSEPLLYDWVVNSLSFENAKL
jgi:hypothetical protein